MDGGRVEFGTAGYTMDHVFVLYDRSSNSVWYPKGETLQAVGGKRRGETIPFLDEPAPISLGEWLDAHENSTVLLPTERDVKRMNRPRVGMRLADEDAGVTVTRVGEGSPAEAAGIREGDVLLSLDGREVTKRRDLREILIGLEAGQAVSAVVVRDSETLELSITPAER